LTVLFWLIWGVLQAQEGLAFLPAHKMPFLLKGGLLGIDEGKNAPQGEKGGYMLLGVGWVILGG